MSCSAGHKVAGGIQHRKLRHSCNALSIEIRGFGLNNVVLQYGELIVWSVESQGCGFAIFDRLAQNRIRSVPYFQTRLCASQSFGKSLNSLDRFLAMRDRS